MNFMKRIRKILLSNYSILLSITLGLLGISTGCGGSEYGPPVAEYGAPIAKFIVYGKIESDSTADKIQNIRVDLLSDTTFSDIEGNYNIQAEAYPQDQTFNIHFCDIDDSLNGNYQDLDTIITFQNPQFTNSETTKELNVKLKLKN
jgi:putative lipoprotein (rSAM/lipoprotein system)